MRPIILKHIRLWESICHVRRGKDDVSPGQMVTWLLEQDLTSQQPSSWLLMDFIPLLGTDASFRIRSQNESHGSFKPDPNF